MHGVTTLDGAHGWDPNWYPWGPQWSNERGFYYIFGEAGEPYAPLSQFIGGED